MQANGKRCCDVCFGAIKKGEWYIAHEIERAEVPWPLAEADVNPQGKLQVDVCVECRAITGMSGTEVVN